MDTLNQTKLSLAEWKSIEEPISQTERKIIELIRDGYKDINKRSNDTQTMATLTKLDITPEIDCYLYQRFLKTDIHKIIEKYGKKTDIMEKFVVKETAIKKIKSVDMLRIKNVESNILENRAKMLEFTLLDFCKEILRSIYKKENKHAFYLYTLIQFKKNHFPHVNCYMTLFCDLIIELGKKHTTLKSILINAEGFIEKNKYLLQYEDISLFSHQKELFSFCHRNKNTPKLVLYTAPTGTGKTLSPIGLSEGYRILFVCAARHVGLALAKSAISLEKKVAFAFGCETASDIRLHYYSAVDYTINKRSGGIGKVDNSNGINVEIMICDVQSYLTAMYYMLSFHEADQLLTYWDEPTISMDYETHALHEIIHRNWQQNKIPNVVLSCATLPREEEIPETVLDFRETFPGAQTYAVTSYDCRKSIPILNKNGYCMLPHIMSPSVNDLEKYSEYCEKNKTLLRYFDLSEIIRFIDYIHFEKNLPEHFTMTTYFQDISEITMNSLKIYYLELLKYFSKGSEESWKDIYANITSTQNRKFKDTCVTTVKPDKVEVKSGGGEIRRTHSVFELPKGAIPGEKIKPVKSEQSYSKLSPTNTLVKEPHYIPNGTEGVLLTTVDAYTLTDGPTIFLAEDIQTISQFYIKMSKIPDSMLQTISQTITANDAILKEIDNLDEMVNKKLQVRDNSDKSNGGGSSERNEKKNWDAETENLMEKINQLRRKIQLVSMDPEYIPNTIPHQKKWTPTRDIYTNSFMPCVGEEVVREILNLEIEPSLKILVLLGIGVLIQHKNPQYEEIVKRLANEQRLFLILASSDYIYGTNYQFCHGMIGKDLKNMTSQKTLQAMGRIGRNNIQQEYTVRFRDDDMIRALFQNPEINMEALMMNRLFCHEQC